MGCSPKQDFLKVRFWNDIWCGNTPLKTSFPSLFTIATLMDAWVCDAWEQANNGDKARFPKGSILE